MVVLKIVFDFLDFSFIQQMENQMAFRKVRLFISVNVVLFEVFFLFVFPSVLIFLSSLMVCVCVAGWLGGWLAFVSITH